LSLWPSPLGAAAVGLVVPAGWQKNKIVNTKISLRLKQNNLKEMLKSAYCWFVNGESFLLLLLGGFSNLTRRHQISLAKLHLKVKRD
jgi:hypothetical protein